MCVKTYLGMLLVDFKSDQLSVGRKRTSHPYRRVSRARSFGEPQIIQTSSHLPSKRANFQNFFRSNRLGVQVEEFTLRFAHSNDWEAFTFAGCERVCEDRIRLEEERVVEVVAPDPVVVGSVLRKDVRGNRHVLCWREEG